MKWDMKMILVLMFILGCTQKHVSYDVIRKVQFGHEKYQRPILTRPIIKDGHDSLKACFNQWFFSSNAEKRKDEAIPLVVRSLCPSHDYLLDTEIEETWWTTIIFTRSCAEVTTSCGKLN